MWLRSYSCCISLLLLIASAHTEDQLQELCEIHLSVSKEASVAVEEWRQQYAQYVKNERNFTETLYLRFYSLQEALSALNTTDFPSTDSCVQLVIPNGTHTVTSKVVIAQNLKMLANDSYDDVIVKFNVSTQENVSTFNVITFKNADYVVLKGIKFIGSPGIIAMESIAYIHVSHCHFSSFDRGALDMYMCLRTVVHNCTFEDNGFSGVTKQDRYRGHAGGLSVGYDDNGTEILSSINRGLLVSDCVFRNNTSKPDGPPISTTRLFQVYQFVGRGGSIAVSINSTFSYNVIIQDCVIKNGYARSSGGGMYIVFSGLASHTTVINSTYFITNNCDGPGGGIHIGYVEGPYLFASSLKMDSSVFKKNSADFGGAIHVLTNQREFTSSAQLSYSANINNCLFTGNTAEFGAAISLSSLLLLVDTSRVLPLVFRDCMFIKNKGKYTNTGTTLSIAHLPLAFYGHNVFDDNEGFGLVLSGTRADIHGSLVFSGNKKGGGIISIAMLATSFSQLRLYKGASIKFDGNYGTIGAAMIISIIPNISRSYSQLQNNPLCVLRYEQPTMPPNTWENVSIQFSNNTSTFGSTVLIDNIDLCSWTGSTAEHFDRQQVFRWNFINYTNDNDNIAHFPDQYNSKWHVQTRAERIVNSGNKTITAYPGQKFSLNITGIDQLGQPISEASHLYDGDILFSPSAAAPDAIHFESITTKYYTTASTEEDVKEYGATNITINTIIADAVAPLQVTLIPKSCPVGFHLIEKEKGVQITEKESNKSFYYCDCNENNNENILKCEGETIILKNGLWASESNEDSAKDKLMVHQCPHYYCQCLSVIANKTVECKYKFNSTYPDQQCHCKRKGILCGSCKNESDGFTALLNTCDTCGYENMLYIVALVIADTIVIAVLLSLKESPSAWLYPTLFYLQVVPYMTFHFPSTFEVFRPYVYFVSSALSFYFAYDFCLGPQIPAIGIYFVKFVPFLISVAVSIVVLLIRNCYYKLHKKAWPGLWWVILFQFTHLVHTCVSVLDCPRLAGKDGVIEPRWYVNGDVTCFEGAHSALAVMSILVLLFCTLIILIIPLYTIGFLQKPYWLANAIRPMTATFKSICRWWGAIELIRRLMVVVMVAAFPGNYFPLIFSLMMSIGLCLFLQPYKSVFANVMEAVLAVNVLVLLEMRNVDVDLRYTTIFFVFEGPGTDNQCLDGGIQATSFVSFVLAPFYYIPLVTFISIAAVSGVVLLRNRYCTRQKMVLEEQHNDNQYRGYYYRAEDNTAASFSVELSGQQIPLSELVRAIFSHRRREDYNVKTYLPTNTLPNRPTLTKHKISVKPRSSSEINHNSVYRNRRSSTSIKKDNPDEFELIELQQVDQSDN